MFRFSKHKHTWLFKGQRFVPGMIEKGGRFRGEIDPEMIFGYTEQTFQCIDCGQYQNQRIIGKINKDCNR